MEENKLIAEFMGMKYSDKRSFNNGEWTHSVRSLSKFHTSWDWLMPVVEKIEFLEEVNDDMSWRGLCTLKGTYNNVVEFIKEYNK